MRGTSVTGVRLSCHAVFPVVAESANAIDRVAQRVRHGGHKVPDDVIRRRFAAGLRNFEQVYRVTVDAWAVYDNAGDKPVLTGWGEMP